MLPYRVRDLKWSWSGDFSIGDDGDLRTTSDSVVGSFAQEVHTRVRSDAGDWEMHPTLGASMYEMIGLPNTPKLAEEGKTRIVNALLKDSFCDKGIIKIRYLPVDRHHILYDLSIQLQNLGASEELKFSLLFDTSEFDIVAL